MDADLAAGIATTLVTFMLWPTLERHLTNLWRKR